MEKKTVGRKQKLEKGVIKAIIAGKQEKRQSKRQTSFTKPKEEHTKVTDIGSQNHRKKRLKDSHRNIKDDGWTKTERRKNKRCAIKDIMRQIMRETNRKKTR